VVDLNLEWPTRDFQDRVNQQKKRNARLAKQLKILRRQQQVPAIHGKIYLCGEGGAGTFVHLPASLTNINTVIENAD
jgi:hypothetical protein